MQEPAGLIDAHQSADIYKVFLAFSDVAALASSAKEPQIFLDLVVGYYLEEGEDALHDPRVFARVMRFREALLQASKGDYSRMPKLGHANARFGEPGYDAAADVIRLKDATAAGLSGAAKQTRAALAAVFQARPMTRMHEA